MQKYKLSGLSGFLSVVAVLSIGIAGLSPALAGVDVPYGEGFEGHSVGTLAEGTIFGLSNGTFDVISSPTIAGSRACRITMDSSRPEFTLNVNQDAANSNVWVQYFAKVTPYDDGGGEPDPGSGACVFYVNTNSTLRAYTTNGSGDNVWTDLGTVNTSSWIGFALQVDCVSSNWDLYVSDSGNRLGVMEMSETSAALGFNTNASITDITKIMVEGQADLDALGVSLGYKGVPTNGVAETNVVTLDIEAGTNLIAAPMYFYDSSSDTLDAKFGKDLATGLDATDTDTARLYWTNGWNYYEYNGTWSKAITPAGSAEIADLHARGRAIWLERGGSARQTVAFFPYVSEVNVGVPIDGTDETGSTSGGFNMAAWPTTESRDINDSNNNFDSLAGWGDRLYLLRDGQYVRLWWNDDTDQWMAGRNPASETMNPGDGFWWYHEGNSNTWDIN